MNNSEITETAKAVQEVAKTTGTAIKTVEKMGHFLSKVMRESIEAVCGMIADDLKIKRWERQVRLVDRVNQIIEERKYADTLTPVPPKIALPIFHEASLEDNDFLQDMWAKLLVAAMHPQESQKIRMAYIDIIKQMEPQDVLILRLIYDDYVNRDKNQTRLFVEKEKKWSMLDPTNYPSRKASIIEKIEIDLNEIDYKTSIDNLIRLQLATPYISIEDVKTEDDSYDVSVHHGYNAICITYLGVFFVKACIIE